MKKRCVLHSTDTATTTAAATRMRRKRADQRLSLTPGSLLALVFSLQLLLLTTYYYITGDFQYWGH
jgi:hypothetical protein